MLFEKLHELFYGREVSVSWSIFLWENPLRCLQVLCEVFWQVEVQQLRLDSWQDLTRFKHFGKRMHCVVRSEAIGIEPQEERAKYRRLQVLSRASILRGLLFLRRQQRRQLQLRLSELVQDFVLTYLLEALCLFSLYAEGGGFFAIGFLQRLAEAYFCLGQDACR